MIFWRTGRTILGKSLLIKVRKNTKDTWIYDRRGEPGPEPIGRATARIRLMVSGHVAPGAFGTEERTTTDEKERITRERERERETTKEV